MKQIENRSNAKQSNGGMGGGQGDAASRVGEGIGIGGEGLNLSTFHRRHDTGRHQHPPSLVEREGGEGQPESQLCP